MNWTAFLLVLAVGLANAQLNFEGNPLTENTEYTAEESRSLEKTARQETTANVTTKIAEHPIQMIYPVVGYVHNSTENILIDDHSINQEETDHPERKQNSIAVQSARQMSSNVYNAGTTSVDPAKIALNSFLNSKTPEESRMSLDYYLQSREAPQNSMVQEQTTIQTINDQQQLMSRTNQQPAGIMSPVNQQLTSQLMQQRRMLQVFPVNQQQQQLNEQMYSTSVNLQDFHSPVSNTVAAPLVQQQQLLQPYVTGLQARNDVFYPVGWHHRMRRLRGKPFLYPQSRKGGPGFYGGLPPVPFKQSGPPVEVIYTKPPGFHRGPPPLSNPPVPYEDASAWFPEADHPPPSKDVYYSQLYAQSYDPHYYNYIAKTGKIKPHLYGKLGKYHEEENDGIWAELYRGFKKHGLKNIMTPTFLLGMTLPVVTLMLTALVQKRSISRSDSRELSKEDTIQEYLEEIQKAIECYEKRRKREANVGGC